MSADHVVGWTGIAICVAVLVWAWRKDRAEEARIFGADQALAAERIEWHVDAAMARFNADVDEALALFEPRPLHDLAAEADEIEAADPVAFNAAVFELLDETGTDQ